MTFLDLFENTFLYFHVPEACSSSCFTLNELRKLGTLCCNWMRRQQYKKRKSFKAKRCRNTLPEVISRIVCNFHEEKNLLFLHGSIVSKLLSFEVKEDLNIRVAKQAGTVFRYCRRLRVFLQRLTMYIENLFFSCDFFACLLFITMLLLHSVGKFKVFLSNVKKKS